MNKKIWGISPIRATLALALCWMMVSCPVSNPQAEDPQVVPDPPVQNPPVQNPPAQFVSGAFNVALAARVSATTSTIVDSGETGTAVLGLGTQVDALQIIPGLALEVWLVNPTYVNTDGSPKDQTAGNPYVIYWDAYDPSAPNTSLKGAAAVGSVEFLAAASGKAARSKIRVGDTLLAKSTGVAVVALLYPNGTAPAAMGVGKPTVKVAEYRLSLSNKANATFSFAGATISFKGGGAIDILAAAVINTFSTLQDVVTADLATSSGTADVSLGSNSIGGDYDVVSASTFILTGLDPNRGVRLVNIAGSAASAPDNILETFVGVDPANTSTSSQAREISYTDSVFVNFAVSPGSSGKVTLKYEDKYGIRGSLAVKMTPK